MPSPTIAEQIRAARRDLKWTQLALAYRAKMTTGEISSIESGRLRPTAQQVERLRKVLPNITTTEQVGQG